MRCIEMGILRMSLQHFIRLIETWDVLKSENGSGCILLPERLIETWDVLKCVSTTYLLSENTD